MRWHDSRILFFGSAGVLFSFFLFQRRIAIKLFRQDLSTNFNGTVISLPLSDKAEKSPRSHHVGSDKPLLVLHVGPPKTGTTTIQGFAKSNRELLWQNGIYYLGNGKFPGGFCTHELVRSCRVVGGPSCAQAWGDLRVLLDLHHALNHTVLLSEENFSAFNSHVENEHLWKYLVPLLKDWQVRIVFAYRRHYELVASLYHQQYNPVPKVNQPIRLKAFKDWPSHGGQEIPTFSQFLDTWESLAFRDPAAIKKRWEANFDDVWVFNFNADGELLQNFFCKMLPEATGVCKHLEDQGPASVQNPSTSKTLQYDMIAVAAYKRDLVNKNLSRSTIVQATQKNAAMLGFNELSDFPLERLPNVQADQLLKHSLFLESTMVPEFHSSRKGKAELESGFSHYQETGRLASVDVDAVLSDSRWIQFFQGL